MSPPESQLRRRLLPGALTASGTNVEMKWLDMERYCSLCHPQGERTDIRSGQGAPVKKDPQEWPRWWEGLLDLSPERCLTTSPLGDPSPTLLPSLLPSVLFQMMNDAQGVLLSGRAGSFKSRSGAFWRQPLFHHPRENAGPLPRAPGCQALNVKIAAAKPMTSLLETSPG